MIRVLVVDDQALVRDGFRAILESQPDCEVVGAAEDGIDAVEQTLRLAPDVVLMDIRMPRLDGVEAARRICSDKRWTGRVIVLTTYGDDENVWDAFHAGASGFLLKTTTAGDLVQGVRSVAAGTELLAPEVTRRLVRQFMSKPRPGEAAPGIAELSERERQVLGHLARGRSNADIARAMFVSEATVKTHINRLFAKLEVRDRVQAVIFAYESGFVSPGPRAEQ
ncbi:response regulator transcription factor [Nocardioides marmoribigeumensis]|jgi:DNA-binding NarL/FixJ family response regulator|uniref:DNA-binding NarL/FixJ family response regulator n=1 Tax=Nocardioides marmoribigeumensis TaxID=433649 RepID=A0ABU2BXK6_9ACTN|nr:response regulator transcription factor [Nocardioides marmoribigeumensis]MDR7363140.1 DNA-binding NarL/FixJ family response regulator [Nocardioides marmoribigeumensis]